MNRSKKIFPAWAVIEKRGNKLGLFSAEVPIFWLRKVAQGEADAYNFKGQPLFYVEKIIIHRKSDK